MGRTSSQKKKTSTPAKTRSQKLKKANSSMLAVAIKKQTGNKLTIKNNKFSAEFKNKMKTRLAEWKRVS